MVKIWGMPVVGRDAEMQAPDWEAVESEKKFCARGGDALHGLAWGDGWAGVRGAVRCSGRGAIGDRVDPGWNGPIAILIGRRYILAGGTAWAHCFLVEGYVPPVVDAEESRSRVLAAPSLMRMRTFWEPGKAACSATSADWAA